jgi:HD-GYP domain-containing protein (c-di-GMP phosphodiesterase class II)
MNEFKDSISIYYTNNNQINILLNNLVSVVRDFTEKQIEQIRRLNNIGIALSAERDLNRLLEMIVDEARSFTNADGGTLYIISDDEMELHFAIVQNTSLDIRMGGYNEIIRWPSVKLKNTDGSPNYSNVSAYAAITGKVVNISDVYYAEGFNFEGTRQFDADTGYRSKSMLVVPMRDHNGDIIGVLQLLNAQMEATKEVIPFSDENQTMTESLASQAAVALSNSRLIRDLENLLESFIKSIVTAIDEKSPYTGGHVRRVSELTMNIAGKMNEVKEGPYAGINFDEDQLKELRMSAWLHDVGKITTPEHIIDKSKKLEAVCDRIEILKARFEILKRDYIIEALRRDSANNDRTCRNDVTNGYDTYLDELDKEYAFLVDINSGDRCLDDVMKDKLNGISSRQWNADGEWRNLVSPDELHNLSVPLGTLTEEEKEIVKGHVSVTHKMLSQLPFPKKLSRVSFYASAHHEKIDGTGYPLGLKGNQIPLQARIIALADVFDALTAKDRPYKKERTLSETVRIMWSMVKADYIDANLFALFLKERIHLDFAKRELAPHQVDMA